MTTRSISRRQFLSRAAAGTAALLAADMGYAGVAPQPPNFVFILAEAHGWGSLSAPMDSAYSAKRGSQAQTPQLGRLAAAGMRFSRAYAPSPRCLPSRAALLTGKTPAQLHMTFVIDENEGKDRSDPSAHPLVPPSCLLELPSSEITVAELLKQHGYATAHFGKWHMGHVDPSRHGFDESDGATSNRGPRGDNRPNPTEAHGIVDRGIAFMRRQVQTGKPFYLQISHYSAHNPEEVSPQALDAFMKRTGVQDRRIAGPQAGAEEMDATTGVLLAALDSLGVSKNTFVIYTSDHGSQARNDNAPLAGGKGTLWEGGIRVPMIVRGPGVAPGAVSNSLVVGHDLMPTICELAGLSDPLPNRVEGGSLAPILTHGGTGAVKRPREEVVFHFPHYDHDVNGPGSALILENYKLVHFYEKGTNLLFDLSKDVGEQRNLAAELPEKTNDLKRRLDAYLSEMQAQMPTANPKYVPGSAAASAVPPGRRRQGGNGGGRPDQKNADRPGKGRKGQQKNRIQGDGGGVS